jgi:branched-chain amino acid transport system substrate-binding protein
MVAQRNKLALFTSASAANLTGANCGTNHLQWTLDTWAMARGGVDAQLKTGGKTWFFITADTAFGEALEASARQFIEAGGAKVLGGVKHPYPGNTDFSSQLVAAQQSGAEVIAIANSGMDSANCIKQANEFGVLRKQKICALYMEAPVVNAVGLAAAQGVFLTESFYWDLNENTRAFSKRFKDKAGALPTQQQAGQYSAVYNYLLTAAEMGVDKAKASGTAVIAAMRAKGTFNDPIYGPTRVREDGRVIHRMYVFQVKGPGESKYDGDIYKVAATIPEEEAFRPMKDGGCPLVKA